MPGACVVVDPRYWVYGISTPRRGPIPSASPPVAEFRAGVVRPLTGYSLRRPGPVDGRSAAAVPGAVRRRVRSLDVVVSCSGFRIDLAFDAPGRSGSGDGTISGATARGAGRMMAAMRRAGRAPRRGFADALLSDGRIGISSCAGMPPRGTGVPGAFRRLGAARRGWPFLGRASPVARDSPTGGSSVISPCRLLRSCQLGPLLFPRGRDRRRGAVRVPGRTARRCACIAPAARRTGIVSAAAAWVAAALFPLPPRDPAGSDLSLSFLSRAASVVVVVGWLPTKVAETVPAVHREGQGRVVLVPWGRDD